MQPPTLVPVAGQRRRKTGDLGTRLIVRERGRGAFRKAWRPRGDAAFLDKGRDCGKLGRAAIHAAKVTRRSGRGATVSIEPRAAIRGPSPSSSATETGSGAQLAAQDARKPIGPPSHGRAFWPFSGLGTKLDRGGRRSRSTRTQRGATERWVVRWVVGSDRLPARSGASLAADVGSAGWGEGPMPDFFRIL
jgi:hypothetical protein